jgi:hypothetical protein
LSKAVGCRVEKEKHDMLMASNTEQQQTDNQEQIWTEGVESGEENILVRVGGVKRKITVD